MKTKLTTLEQTLQVWALPRSDWEMRQKPELEPFKFSVRTDKPWSEGAVKVHEADVKIVIPEGIDITTMAIETLREAQKEVRAEADKKVSSLADQINNLLMLEHKPDLEVIK